ncbi:hypothetical protein ASC94_11510 [Massilia sp. Root418]|uniref:hypothetical protein n=1 Tax=Massilia sp. Root418 TaxID=1736532 RepID=UPI0006F225A2|nr:hypothetical protein [Massilia sp. Root418]KQW93277.1 hypothetical protein ASC94_11510 [Massilia sp. Root418]
MNYSRLRYGALLIILAGLSKVCAAGAAEEKDIWDVIRGMRTVAIGEVGIQELFGAKIRTRTDNGYWKFHEGIGPALGDGVTIDKFGFMTKNDATAAPWIYMNISGHCVRLDDIRKEYPNVAPDGFAATIHAPIASYVTKSEEWELKFSFRVHDSRRPECLENVGFSPQKRKPPISVTNSQI